METMNDGDILLYLDCGCEIDIRKKSIILEYLEYVKTDLIIGTVTQIEKHWNKMDLLIKLDINYPKYLDTRQRQGGAILFYICDKTRHLVNLWYDTCCDYHMIDDTPSIAANLPGFREHRHDQSVFSLLTKKYNIFSNKSLNNCISYIRNKSDVSRLV